MGLQDAGVPNHGQEHTETVEEFKATLYEMQQIRRKIVLAVLSKEAPSPDFIPLLEASLERLKDRNTSADLQRNMRTASNEPFAVNVSDEIRGLEKDLTYLHTLCGLLVNGTVFENVLKSVELNPVLRAFHPKTAETFDQEYDDCKRFLKRFVGSAQGVERPIFVTDWDGTMKDYCSQYATNIQPIYSAISLARFATNFTKLAAVLTAGPLRGPGILDLTSLPINGPLVFSGSWGREWWLHGKRVVHNDGIPDEGFDALERMNDEVWTNENAARGKSRIWTVCAGR
ncbi:hypothetical protein L596_020353 [Steinernema carpocapsae]|uniref:Uncharacterized protein n=1 Tax=Steinernema carpocapsae TaxID=34508 RepID=A0A4U5MT96_STECR|nr:hypothetical protein L596_020353 [Steinernema carpocapsae]